MTEIKVTLSKDVTEMYMPLNDMVTELPANIKYSTPKVGSAVIGIDRLGGEGEVYIIKYK